MSKKIKEPFVIVPKRLLLELSPNELQLWCLCKSHSRTFNVTRYTIAKALQQDPAYIGRKLNNLVLNGYLTAETLSTGVVRYKIAS